MNRKFAVGTSGADTESRKEPRSAEGNAQEAPDANAPFRIEFSADPAPRSGAETTISYAVRLPAGGAARDLQRKHGALSHLVLVSEDLQHFDHVHPAYDAGAGVFSIPYTFPSGGSYVLFADATRADGGTHVQRHALHVEGAPRPRMELHPSAGTVVGDGLRVELVSRADSLRTGDAVLTFCVTDAQGRPVRDIQPYLEAAGHLIIISADSREFLHAHPVQRSGDAHHGGAHEAGADHGAHGSEGPFGPELAFQTAFEHPGRYKAWMQFRRGEDVHTAPFVIDVHGDHKGGSSHAH